MASFKAPFGISGHAGAHRRGWSRCYPRAMRAPPARRYLQVGLPLAVGALLIVPLWLGRPGSPPPPGASSWASAPAAQPTHGSLPDLAGPTLSGVAFDAAAIRGRVTVVNFWNADCPPCAREAPAIARAWSSLHGDAVAFVGVMYVGGNWPDDREAARAFADRYAIRYPIVVDEGSAIARAAGIPGIPVTIVTDAGGVMRYRIVGPVHRGQLESLVRTLTG